MTTFNIDTRQGNNPLIALQCVLLGLKFLGRRELRKFLLLPLLINVLLYSLALWAGYSYIGELIERLIPAWLDWLRWILWPLFFVCFFAGTLFSFTLFANLLAAPFYGKLAQRTAELLAGRNEMPHEPPVMQAVWAEAKRMLYILSRALPLLLLFLIPVINLAAPLLWALFGAWCMAMEYLSYPLENRGLLFSEQRSALHQVRFGATCLGGLTMLGLALPLLNILVPPVAVIAATAYVQKISNT